ncbi:MAG: hypothetical protein NTV86_13080 [Planctomycetota bacterium]|nr:hypothetical protein [Planctomycetota bacterium]
MISRKLQLLELLRNPPENVPAELQTAWAALLAAYTACSKAKRKKWRQDVRDAVVGGLPAHVQGAVMAGIDADIAADTGVNP